jgi:RNA polymerase sigma factor (sigma-70 family)
MQVAEEIAQEAFLAAWKSRGDFGKRPGTFKAWLNTIARNKVRDYWKKKSLSISDQDVDTEGEEVEVDENLRRHELVVTMILVLRNHPQEEQRIIRLYYFDFDRAPCFTPAEAEQLNRELDQLLADKADPNPSRELVDAMLQGRGDESRGYQEIADEVGTSVSNVCRVTQRYRLACKKLQRHRDGEEEDEEEGLEGNS